MVNFWSLLKRTLKGMYVSVDPVHLFRYCDEQAFRYNNRKGMDDADRFVTVMRQIVGKRISYDELIGKTKPKELSSSEAVPSEDAAGARKEMRRIYRTCGKKKRG